MMRLDILLIGYFMFLGSMASPDEFRDEVSNFLKSQPPLAELSSKWIHSKKDWKRDVEAAFEFDNDEEEAEEVCFVEETEKFKELFRYLDNDRNGLSKILEESSSCRKTRNKDPLTELRSSELESVLLQLIPTMENDDGNMEALLRKLEDILKPEMEYYTENMAVKETDPSWEECLIDYNGFVEPITRSIAISVICGVFSLPACDRLTNLSLTVPDWGRRMIDAMAKIPTTLNEGPLSWVGAYDMCQAYEVTYDYRHNRTHTQQRNFRGKYCRLDMTTMVAPNSSSTSTLTLQFGVCVPDTCGSREVEYYISQYNLVLRAALKYILNMNITYVYCGMEDLDPATDGALQTALIITLIFVVMVVIATIYDGFFRKSLMEKHIEELSDYVNTNYTNLVDNKSDKETLLRSSPFKITILNRCEMFLVGFSAYTNFRKLFTTRKKPGDIPVLNGVRYTSYVYAMLGETYVLGPIYFEAWVTSNILGAIPRLTKTVLFQPIMNYHLAEDSFLLISGILVTYWFLRRIEENSNKLSFKGIVYYIVHRYWRLMPVMMLSIMIFTCTYKYAADGPLFPPSDRDGENCRVNWWVDMLMVHNIVKVNEQCFGHAWFVPLVFQLHLAALVVVIPLVIKPIFGYVMIGVMYAVHIGVTAGISTDLRNNRMGDWYNEYLITPWCRAGPFIIGLAFGIVLHNRRLVGLHIHKLIAFVLWLVALVCILMPSFASYSQYKEGGERWTNEALIAYDTLARSSWALGVGWIVLACHFGHGGVIDSFLSWIPWGPLSRLVYTTMLMHGMFIFTFVYTSRLPIYIESYHMLYALLGHLIVCMIIGLIISLIWDLPLGTGVEKAIIADTKFHWIRAGRHSRKKLDDVENKFWGLEETDPTAEKVEADGTGKPTIPNCQYLEVDPMDLKGIAVIANGTADGKGSAVNQKNDDIKTAGYANPAYNRNYDTAGENVYEDAETAIPIEDYTDDDDENEDDVEIANF